MLRKIKISHFAILPEVSIPFSHGLNVLTGETGAGKSILVDAISLLAGRRATSDDVRAGEKQAVIEGLIELASDSIVWSILDEAGVAYDDYELVIRRTVSADGRNKIYVNDWQWTVSGLAQLAPHWIDISGQHGQQALLEKEHHLQFLDHFGQYENPLADYQSVFQKALSTQKELNRLKKERKELEAKKDFLSFQLEELDSAELVPGEEEELRSLHSRMKHGEKLAEAVGHLQEVVDQESGLLDLLGKAEKEIRMVTDLDASLEPWSQELSVMSDKLNDLSRWITDYMDKMDFDPAEVERIHSRFAQLQKISRKYGSVEKAIGERDQIRKALNDLEVSDERERDLENELKFQMKDVLKKASNLSSLRKNVSKEFCDLVSEELSKLGMPDAELRIKFTAPGGEPFLQVDNEKRFDEKGAESIVFEIAPNPGEGFKELAKVASGGELSRILLAIKAMAMLDHGALEKTFLFDEVDTGIGGETAERVGIRLAGLARGRQVLCVTHLAQIASYADAHMVVSKKVEEGRTVAGIETLQEERRIDELARMIGGIKVTEKTIDHAKELLRQKKEFSKAFDSKRQIRKKEKKKGKSRALAV